MKLNSSTNQTLRRRIKGHAAAHAYSNQQPNSALDLGPSPWAIMARAGRGATDMRWCGGAPFGAAASVERPLWRLHAGTAVRIRKKQSGDRGALKTHRGTTRGQGPKSAVRAAHCAGRRPFPGVQFCCTHTTAAPKHHSTQAKCRRFRGVPPERTAATCKQCLPLRWLPSTMRLPLAVTRSKMRQCCRPKRRSTHHTTHTIAIHLCQTS